MKPTPGLHLKPINPLSEGWGPPLYDSLKYREIVNGASLVTPDGMPLVWTLRILGKRDASRVYGPLLMPSILEAAAQECIPVGFLGGSPNTLETLLEISKARYPALRVVYACSPPFRELKESEDQEIIEGINTSGARVLFVGLGCPKQEHWMAQHVGNIRAMMVGVGAAFDFIAGAKSQAPNWMMNVGLEWFFRLMTEPRRLWRRYMVNNPRFIFLVAMQLLKKSGSVR